MTAKDYVNWEFSERRQKCVYVLNEIKTGKFTFHKTENAVTENEHQQQMKDKPNELHEPEEFCISVSWEIESGEPSKLQNASKKELLELLQIITIKTNFLFDVGAFVHSPAQGHKTLAFTSVLQEPYKELTKETIEESVLINEKISNMPEQKKTLLYYALTWYSRGLQEYDIPNKYASYWIGLETLSLWFDGPSKVIGTCDNCKQLIYNKSINRRMKDFIKQIGITNISNKEFNELSETRSSLFHVSSEGKIKTNLEKLRKLLKSAFEKCLELEK